MAVVLAPCLQLLVSGGFCFGSSVVQLPPRSESRRESFPIGMGPWERACWRAAVSQCVWLHVRPLDDASRMDMSEDKAHSRSSFLQHLSVLSRIEGSEGSDSDTPWLPVAVVALVPLSSFFESRVRFKYAAVG